MKKLIILCAVVALTQFSNAATLLCDFSAFTPQGLGPDWGAFYASGWSDDGSGPNPALTFHQNPGSYDIRGQKENTNNLVDYYFGSGNSTTTISLGVLDDLKLTANTFSENLATGFFVNLWSDNQTKWATYAVTIGGGANQLGSAQSTITLSNSSVDSGFTWTAVEGFRIIGTSVGSGTDFAVNFDNLSAAAAVPEPATWALLAGSLTTVMVFRRRREEV